MPVNISMPSSGKTILLSLFDETGVSGGGELREAEQPTQTWFVASRDRLGRGRMEEDGGYQSLEAYELIAKH